MANTENTTSSVAGADWASILSQVATIGINLLGAFVLSTNRLGVYEQGDVLWLQTDNDILAFNAGEGPLGLSYAKTGVQNVGNGLPPLPYAVTEYQALPKNSQTSQATNLSEFQDGALCIGKVNSPVNANANTSTVTFSVALLSFNVTVNVIKNLSLTVTQNASTQLYQIVLASTGPVIQSATATAKDARGGTFTASANFSANTSGVGDYLYTLTFPQGADFAPLVESLNIILSVETVSYLRATEESCQNLTYGMPEELRVRLPEHIRARLAQR